MDPNRKVIPKLVHGISFTDPSVSASQVLRSASGAFACRRLRLELLMLGRHEKIDKFFLFLAGIRRLCYNQNRFFDRETILRGKRVWSTESTL